MSWRGSLAAGSLWPSSGVEEFYGGSSQPARRSSDSCGGEDDDLIDQGSPRRRVKDDLSEFTKTLSGKLWGVASFLTPTPSSQTPTSSSSPPRAYSSAESSPPLRSQQQDPTISEESELMASFDSRRTAGIRSDFAEIGGSLKTGIARLSNNMAISGISKIASTFLPLREEEEKEEEVEGEEVEVEGDEDEEEEVELVDDEDVCDVIGVTDEVLAFAKNIACHPETWLDFPLMSDDEDFDDFDMSVVQQNHALVIESLAPRLAALRIELCPTHMSIGCFWKVYFALLHPRLNKHDADLLSTPQIVEARAMLQLGLQSQAKRGSSNFSSFKNAEYMTCSLMKDFESGKHPATLHSDDEFVDKFVVNEQPYLQKKVVDMALNEEDDEWPEDETQDASGAAVMPAILACNGEDISFSDLEDDDYQCLTKQAFKACSISE